MSSLISTLPRFVYGTTRLGDDSLPHDDRVRMAVSATKQTSWFHTSDQYGTALPILREAFDTPGVKAPQLIVKIGWSSVEEVRRSLEAQRDALGVPQIDLGQLCLSGELAEDYANGRLEGLQALKAQGLVKGFVLEVFPWTSELPLRALRAGHAQKIIDAHIFYLNPLQRFADNGLWDFLVEHELPIVAMRSVGGGDVHRLRDVPGAAWKPYLQQRAAQIAPLFERSGLATWSEFCLRFVRSLPQVKASVGSTCREPALQELIRSSQVTQPLPEALVSEILELQRQWSVDTDGKAEPWSM